MMVIAIATVVIIAVIAIYVSLQAKKKTRDEGEPGKGTLGHPDH